MTPGQSRRPVGDEAGPAGPLIAAVAAALLCGLALMLLQGGGSGGRMAGPEKYTYMKVRASNGVILHVIRTRPDNIVLRAVDSNVTDTELFGVNGGFFYEGALLSMAVVDGLPAKGAYGDYGSGTVNAKLARGTLVWDRAARSYSVQIVQEPEELTLTDHGRYWAQGGVSMSLGAGGGDAWLAQALAERLPFHDEARLRTGAVYDEAGELYLVVSSTRETAEAFRTAVLEKVGGGRLVDGIFLDGDGSSQLRCRESQLDGDGRPVFQMLALVS